MPRQNRRYEKPHYDLARVHSAAAHRDIVITGKASTEAVSALPRDIIDIDGEIREIVVSLTAEEFVFTEKRTRKIGPKRVTSIVDVYRVDFEGSDIWMKLKIEQDNGGDFVLIISFHEWDTRRPI
jgi:Motility quorum-sensing regulator, toxin of MqsA